MQLSRRDLLRWGIVLGGGAVLPASRRVSRADDLPSSPRTTPFIVELTREDPTGQEPHGGIPPLATEVAQFHHRGVAVLIF